jgi:zinc transport system ATP-binding protein
MPTLTKPDHTQNIIELKDISFSYGDDVVLDRITLNIHKGDYLGIIGPNGGGKTTLLKIMLGLLKPSKGTVKLFGQDIHEFKDYYKIGYVPQKVAKFDENYPATVLEVVSMGRYGKRGLFKPLNSNDNAQVKKALEEVGMFEFNDRLIGDLSGGQQQRVFIARALSSEPEVIFLDEPTVGVDLKTQEAFYKLLDELNRSMGLTLVLVSHDIDMIAGEATELASINKTLVYHGSPKEFIKGDFIKNLYGKGVKPLSHQH